MFDDEIFEHDGMKFRVTFPIDDSGDTPWEREDGHGAVSDWRYWAQGQGVKPPKSAGERILIWNRGDYRTYDFAGAVALALKDGWGVSAYRMDTERGANGLLRVTGQWFEGRKLQTFSSEWCDDINAATRAVFAAHRATFPSAKAYAAAAAEEDFNRLLRWCDDQWCYVGVVVTLVDDEGGSLGETESLWGIESDSTEYLEETAHELAGEIVSRLMIAGGAHAHG